MHNWTVRLYSLLSFAVSVLMVLMVCVHLTSYLYPTTTFQEITRAKPTSVYRKSEITRPNGIGELTTLPAHDALDLYLTMDYDLTPAFNWNVKQIFLAVVAEWEDPGCTPCAPGSLLLSAGREDVAGIPGLLQRLGLRTYRDAEGPSDAEVPRCLPCTQSQVVWDRVIRRGDKWVFSGKEKSKYPLSAYNQLGTLKDVPEVRLKMTASIMPYAGLVKRREYPLPDATIRLREYYEEARREKERQKDKEK